jgi:hypothetical protein
MRIISISFSSYLSHLGEDPSLKFVPHNFLYLSLLIYHVMVFLGYWMDK